jgi:TolA-binding protein
MSSAAVPSAVTFLNDFGDSLTTVNVIKRMAEIASEMTNWYTSIDAYNALLDIEPYSPDAPRYQLKIAQAYEELGDMASAANARDDLIERYGADSQWYENIGDSTVLAVADSLRGSSFEDAIQYYLEQTVATEDDPVAYRQVNETLIDRIENYIQQFPNSSKIYEYQFYLGDAYYHTKQYIRAGDVYFNVAMDSSSFQRQEDALNNAFSSYLIAYEETPGIDSVSVREKLRNTAMIYRQLYPQGENIAFFLWAAAPKFYNAGDYETAREMFQIIYDDHRGSGYEARSAKFIADSYQQQEMYSQAEEWYENAQQAAIVSGEDLGADIEYLAASSAYNDAASLAENEDTESLMEAAQRWEQTARDHAGSEVAPVAMYDAAETYGKAGSINDAVRLFRELASTYPSYENAPTGLLRAAYLLREDQQYTRAAQLYQEAYNSYPNAPDMNEALASAADSYEEAGEEELAMGVYQQIASQGAGTAAAVTEAYAKLGEYNYSNGNLTLAKNDFESCMTIYDQYSDGRIRYPAMAAYYIGEIASRDYYALTPVNTDNVEYKTQLFNGAVAKYNKTFTYLDDEFVFRAVLRIGKLQEDFANSVGFMEAPEGLTPEGEEAFYNTLMQAYDTYIQRATSTYQNGLQLALTNGIRSEYTDSIATSLDLLLPGTSSDLGYMPSTGVDSLSASDSTGTTAVEEDITQESTQEENGSDDSLQQDQADDGETQDDITPVVESRQQDSDQSEEGGGCFLWPF